MKNRIIFILISLGAFITVYPVCFLLAGSFMHPAELSGNLAPVILQGSADFVKWPLLPEVPTLRSYIKVIFETPEFFVVFWNSIKIAAGAVLGQLVFGVPVAWGFAKYSFRCKNALFMCYIILMMLPFQAIMLSEYLVLSNLRLLDSLWAIILPGVFSTFPVFVLYNFFSEIPDSIVEAARIDGLSELGIFLKVGIPLGKTGIVAALVLQFLEYWNLVEQPMTFIESKTLWPLTLYLPEISLENAGQAFVASVISLVPTMLIFILTRNHLEKGIVASAVKE